MFSCYVWGFLVWVLFLFSSQSFKFSQQTQKEKTTAESSKKALVLQIAHWIIDPGNLADVPKGVRRGVNGFSKDGPLLLIKLVFILLSKAVTSRKKLPTSFLIHFPYIGFLKDTRTSCKRRMITSGSVWSLMTQKQVPLCSVGNFQENAYRSGI